MTTYTNAELVAIQAREMQDQQRRKLEKCLERAGWSNLSRELVLTDSPQMAKMIARHMMDLMASSGTFGRHNPRTNSITIAGGGQIDFISTTVRPEVLGGREFSGLHFIGSGAIPLELDRILCFRVRSQVPGLEHYIDVDQILPKTFRPAKQEPAP